MISLPRAFATTMQARLGAEWEAFLQALNSPAPVSLRFHLLKHKKWSENYEKVKWCFNGVYLPERPVFTLDPAFHAGAYYVQEASSMLVCHLLQQVFPNPAGIRALDLAAAPGGKSTLLAEWLGQDGFLVANEVIRSRFQTLDYNHIKWGYANTVVSNHDSQDFSALENWFDLILLDAPCSGEGLFRKDPGAMAEWSPDNVAHCAARQKRILADAVRLLKPGGILLYSTCTYNEAENDDNVQWMGQTFGFESIFADLPDDWGISRTLCGLQCYPHRVKGEGFYLAALQKTGDGPTRQINSSYRFSGWGPLPGKYQNLIRPFLRNPHEFSFYIDSSYCIRALPKDKEETTGKVAQALHRCRWGIEVGQIKGKDFIPAPELALSNVIEPDLPAVTPDRATALRYLKKEPVDLPGAPGGWVLVRYDGLNLGWAKVLQNRTNNYYPKAWRILMELPPEFF